MEVKLEQNRVIKLPKIEAPNQKSCNQHVFCAKRYEFNDQSYMLKKLHQPHSTFTGEELPTPHHDLQSLINGDIDQSFQGLSEEALDDWIAQSFNRPIISFLDPYKKFKAPDNLIQKLRKRYGKLLLQKEADDEKKMLYFDDRSNINKNPHYMLPTRQPKETNKDVIFNYHHLNPKSIKGTTIQQRENQKWSEMLQEKQTKNNSLPPDHDHAQSQLVNTNFHITDNNQTEKSRTFHGSINTYNPLPRKIENNGQKAITSRMQKNRSQTINDKKSVKSYKDDIMDDISKQVLDLIIYGNERSHTINNADLNNLQLHLPFEQDLPNLSKKQMTDIQFSHYKAVRRIQKQNFTDAIQCCKETLQLDSHHIDAIYNLACLYETTKRYSLSKQWFEIGQSLNIKQTLNWEFGIALCNYKLGNLTEAKEWIEQKVDDILKLSKADQHPKREFIYLRALCNRINGNLEEAQQDYQQFIQLCCPSDFDLLKNLMFTVLFKKIRNLESKFDQLLVADFMTLIRQIGNSIVFKEPLYALEQNPEQMMRHLEDLPFFRRFTRDECQVIFDRGELQIYNKDDVYFPIENHVIIITAGHMVVYDHRQGFDTPQVVQYCGPGDIIGDKDKDNYMSGFSDIWFQVTSPKLELLKVSMKMFNQFWEIQQKNASKRELYDFVQKMDIFQGVSSLGISKLCQEYLEIKDFKKNDVIFNMGEGLDERQGIKLKKIEDGYKIKKSKLTQLSSKLDKPKVKGFYFIKQGLAELQTNRGQMDYVFNIGEFFGENLIFNTESISRYGKIVAKTDYVKCFLLNRDNFAELNKMDRQIMKNNIIFSPRYVNLVQQIRDYEINNEKLLKVEKQAAQSGLTSKQ